MMTFDNRTYIVLLIISTIFWFLLNKNIQLHLIVVLNASLLAIIGQYKKAIKFAITYLSLVLLAGFFANKIALMYIILNMLARSIPLVMLVTCIVVGNANKLMASLQKIKIPRTVIIMICIMIRFFPVLSKEVVIIKDGMRARGIFYGWRDVLRNPFLSYECFIVPLIIRCIKLSDELGATAEIRGFNTDTERSCIYKIRFGLKDVSVIVLYGIMTMLIYLEVWHW